ncbi:condensation domain-containing protein, partial [Xanthomonas sp. LMG 8992]|uniref:condensation domain-containing protein n=1 Tax=Xanthomonas sp. LMG 8992 TaxID=1591157 RepID=UPI00272C15F9
MPDYMVPAAFVCLPALPLSANGKLDRKALPAPQDDAFARHAYAPPHPGTEALLAEAWCRLLGRERIGRHDQFFALGGNSLLAVRLLSRIEAACGVRLSLAEVFAHPTLRELAQAVTRHQTGVATAALPAIVPVHHGDTLPLSFAQQRLWFLAQLEGTGTAYHMPGALRLRGDLDPLALRRALDALLQRHAALRTVFATSADGQPLAHLLPAGQAFPLVEHDLGIQPDQAAAIARLAHDEVLAPFDLARGPLIRGRLLRLGQADHVLLITQHHIVSDGWSLGILINDLGALYRAMLAGQPDPLPPLAVQYPDYAAWQRHWFTAERLGKQLDYWSRCLADAPVLLTLPTDRPRPATPSHAGASVPIALDATLTRALKRLGQQHHTTLFMTLAAAWAAVLARLAGQHEVVIGTPSANRSRQEIEPLVGFFVNTLPLRIDLSGEPTVSGLLERVRAAALGAQDHQDVPFEQIVERINPPRQLEHAPLFQVLFDWQNNDPGTLDLPGLLAEPLATPFDRIKFD